MKKITALILCILMILPTAIISNAYSGTDAMNILKSMGVISGNLNGDLMENNLVTRAEFAKMAVLLSEYKSELSLNSMISVFDDCPYTHWSAPYVKTAVQHGIIEGYSDGLFRPEKNISYTEAVTIALRLLGYSSSDFGNAYPEPQRAMALSLNLNNGVSKSDDELLTRSELAVILSNTLTADNKAGNNYASSLGYTIADDVILIATNDENSSVTPGRVYTSNGEYNIGGLFDKNLLGRKGTAVIDTEGYLLTLLDNGARVDEYAVYSVYSDNISLYGSDGLISFWADSGTLAYDGIQASTFSSMSSKLTTGDIIKLAHTENGGIDYMLYSGSDFSGPYTVTEDGVIPLDGDFNNYSMLRNGVSVEADAVKKNDIVYISPSLMTIFAYNKKAGGIYSSASPDRYSPTSITVSGTEYEIESPLAFSKLTSGGITVGDSIVLLLGREGGVADIISETDIKNNTGAELMPVENTIPDSLAVLSVLGAVSDTSYNDSSAVTRAEFAKMAVMVSEFRKTVATDVRLTMFPDCPYTHWASPYIKTAAENSLMSAYADSCFYPDNAINLAEAVDCALKILGYSDSDFGDYPSSQLSLAASKSLTGNIHKNAYDSISKADAAELLYNTLLSSVKGGSQRLLEKIGYRYYEDDVIIATNAENSSVPFGKVLTSSGTYTIDESFSSSYIGTQGSVLTYSGNLAMYNPAKGYMQSAVVYSVIPGGLMFIEDGNFMTVSVDDDVTVYLDAKKSSFSSAKASISAGDSVYMGYDTQKRLLYIHVDSSDTFGPYAVNTPSSWYVSVNGASENTALLKNGKKISISELSINDIIYYTPSLDTAFVYSDKRIGSFENASPVKDTPSSITVSGTKYDLETASAMYADAEYGDILVLCFGKDGRVAHSYPLSDTEIGGCLISSGVKEFVNSYGDKYTSLYVRLVLADSTELDIPVSSNYENQTGNTMKISFTDGKPRLSAINGGFDISGRFDAEGLTIGTSKLASDVKIMDVSFDNNDKSLVYKTVYPQRLDSISISKKDVLYAKTYGGYISELILKNVTGDAYKYGVITNANARIEGFNVSGSYTCDVGGSSYSYSGGVYTNLRDGSPVRVTMSNGRVDGFTALDGSTVKISDIGYTDITLSDGTVLKLSDELKIYRIVNLSEYTLIPVSELSENISSYNSCSIYSDKSEASGGRVRIIIVR